MTTIAEHCKENNPSCSTCFPDIPEPVRQLLRNPAALHSINVGLVEIESGNPGVPVSELKRKTGSVEDAHSCQYCYLDDAHVGREPANIKPVPKDEPGQFRTTTAARVSGTAGITLDEARGMYEVQYKAWLDSPHTSPVKDPRGGSRAFVKCCGDVIQSVGRHDFVTCNCGQSYIDGGAEYTRVGSQDLSDVVILED